MSNVPEVGSVWRHRNGAEYRVIHLANFYSSDVRYPLTVVYQGVVNGKVWSRPMDQWHRSMTLVAEATQPAAGEPVYQLRSTVFKRPWREVDQVEYDKAASLSGYERRLLWKAPPAAAHGDEAVRKMVLPERIDRRQYLGGRGDAVAQGWNDCLNWIDKANAMRAQGDGESNRA